MTNIEDEDIEEARSPRVELADAVVRLQKNLEESGYGIYHKVF